MKNLVPCVVAGGMLLAAFSLSAQTTQTPTAQQTAAPAKTVDRGSEGAITMEEYQALSEQFQKANPGKTFQSLSKEEFETYLTTELEKLRKKKAEEAAQKEKSKQTAEPK